MKIKLGRIQRLILWITGRVYLGHRKKPGWVGSRPSYVFRCPDHGLVESFTHGWEEDLICPECDRQ